MRVTIKRFRSWESLCLEFQPGQTHLLKGPSGIGKSTAVEAILWCLYGNVRNVTPFDAPRAQTSVTIEVPGFRVARSRAPNLLRCTVGETVCEGDDAQAAVDARFGPWALFSVTSMVSQKSRNLLLTMSNSEKLEILRMLSLGSDDPERYIRLLEERIALATTKLAKWEIKHKRAAADLAALPQSAVPEDPARLASLLARLPTLQRDLSLCEERQEEERRKAERNAQRESLRATYSSQIESLPTAEISERVTASQLLAARAARASADRRSAIQKRLTSLPPPDPSECMEGCLCSAKAAERAVEVEACIRREEKAAAHAGVAYDRNAVALARREWEETLAQDAYARVLDTRPEAPQEAMLVPPESSPDRSAEVARAQSVVASLEAAVALAAKRMSCPHCEGAFYVSGNKAVKSTGGSPKELEAAKRECRDLLALVKAEGTAYSKALSKYSAERAAADHALSQYKKDMSSFSKREEAARVPHPSRPSADQVKRAASALRNTEQMRFPDAPAGSAAQILACVANASARKDRAALERELAALPEPSSPADPQIEKKREAYVKSKTLARSLSARRVDLVRSLSQVPPDEEADAEGAAVLAAEALERARKAEAEIATLRAAEKCALAERAASACHDKRAFHQGQLSVHKKLRELVGDAECEAYRNTLDNINSLLGDLLPLLFAVPISASLQGFKTTKTTRATKQNLNFAVKYGDAQLDSIRQLSGGEGDRLSLLLTLALHRQTSSPLLMLDECFASLDSEAKDQALEVVRQHTDCVVLVIQHDGVEGSYDEETDLADHR